VSTGCHNLTYHESQVSYRWMSIFISNKDTDRV